MEHGSGGGGSKIDAMGGNGGGLILLSGGGNLNLLGGNNIVANGQDGGQYCGTISGPLDHVHISTSPIASFINGCSELIIDLHDAAEVGVASTGILRISAAGYNAGTDFFIFSDATCNTATGVDGGAYYDINLTGEITKTVFVRATTPNTTIIEATFDPLDKSFSDTLAAHFYSNTQPWKWNTPQQLTTVANSGYEHGVVLNNQGHFMFVWNENDLGCCGDDEIQSNFDIGSGLSADTLVDSATNDAIRPYMAFNRNDQALVVYNAWGVTTARHFNGTSWQTEPTFADIWHPARPALTADNNGAVVGVGPAGNLRAALWNGSTFAASTIIDANTGLAVSSESFDVAANDDPSNPKIVVTWVEDGSVYYSVLSGTVWSAPALVESSAELVVGSQDHEPQVAISPDGTKIMVVWIQWDSVGGQYQVFSNFHNGTTWQGVTQLSTTPTTWKFKPNVAINNAGQAMAMWWDDGNPLTHDLDSAYFNGTSWSGVTTVQADGSMGQSPNRPTTPQIVIQNNGESYALWRNHSTNTGGIGTIMTAYAFGKLWDAPVQLATNVSTSKYSEPQLTMNYTNGKGIAAWIEGATIRYAHYSQHIDYIAPTVPNPTVAIDNVDGTEVTLSFNDAADETTLVTNLRYQVYYHTQEIYVNTSVEATLQYGTPFGSPSTSKTVTVTGLTPDETYWFNVVVRDEAGNAAQYAASTATTPAALVQPWKWNTPQQLSTSPSTIYESGVKMNAQGHYMFTWNRLDTGCCGDDDIVSNYNLGSGLTDIVPAATVTQDAIRPYMAFNYNDRALVAYNEWGTSKVAYFDGGSWQPPTIHTLTHPARPALTRDNKGVVVAPATNPGPLRSLNFDGSTFTGTSVIDANNVDAMDIDITASDNGAYHGIAVAYHRGGEIYFSATEDGGATWSAPLMLSTGTANARGGSYYRPRIAMGPDGKKIAVIWTEYWPATSSQQAFGRVYNGTIWEPIRLLSTSTTAWKRFGNVVINNAGQAMFMWWDHKGNISHDLDYAYYDGAVWNGPTTFLADASFGNGDASPPAPEMGMLPNGDTLAIWRTHSTSAGGDAQVWASYAFGNTWDTPKQLDDLTNPNKWDSPQLGFDHTTGKAVAFWRDDNGTMTYAHYSEHIDYIPPTVPDPNIMVGVTTGTEVNLAWTVADDETTVPANLTYQVFYHTDPTFVTNGAQVMIDWAIPFGTPTVGMLAATVTGLANSTDYWFNVVVWDEAGNPFQYDAVMATTAASLLDLASAVQPALYLGNASDTPYAGGGGSGGGISLNFNAITGSGNIRARGGNGGFINNCGSSNLSSAGGGGGGGRIRAVGDRSSYTGTISATAGSATAPASNGSDGLAD